MTQSRCCYDYEMTPILLFRTMIERSKCFYRITLRPGKRHVDGHNYPSKRKSKNSVTGQHLLVEINEILAKVTDININDISDDDWSDDSDDEN